MPGGQLCFVGKAVTCPGACKEPGQWVLGHGLLYRDVSARWLLTPAFAPDTSHLSTALSTHRHWLNTCSSNNSDQRHQHLLPRSASRMKLKLWIFHLASLNLLGYFIWFSWCTEQPTGLSHMLAACGPATQNRLSIREQPVLTAWAFLPPEGIKAL